MSAVADLTVARERARRIVVGEDQLPDEVSPSDTYRYAYAYGLLDATIAAALVALREERGVVAVEDTWIAYQLPDGRVVQVRDIDEPSITYTLEDGRTIVEARRVAS